MAAKEGIGKASAAAKAARRNRYVQRLIEDEDVHRSLLAAYSAACSAYGRMHNGKPATKALLQDRKLQRELAAAAGALREASDTLTQKPRKRRRKRGIGRLILFAVFAGIAALVLSEGLRSKVLDLLFGAEEEFDYSSTTTPAQPAPTEGATSAQAS